MQSDRHGDIQGGSNSQRDRNIAHLGFVVESCRSTNTKEKCNFDCYRVPLATTEVLPIDIISIAALHCPTRHSKPIHRIVRLADKNLLII